MLLNLRSLEVLLPIRSGFYLYYTFIHTLMMPTHRWILFVLQRNCHIILGCNIGDIDLSDHAPIYTDLDMNNHLVLLPQGGKKQQQSSIFNLGQDLLDDFTNDDTSCMIHGLLVSPLAGRAEQSCWWPPSPSEPAQKVGACSKKEKKITSTSLSCIKSISWRRKMFNSIKIISLMHIYLLLYLSN